MADSDTGAPAEPNGEDTSPGFGILAQYVKDMSFENPSAPGSFQNGGQPTIELGINVNARMMGDGVFEVELKIKAEAKTDGQATFLMELVYAGLFGLRNVPEEAVEPFLVVEAPRLLFPFARRIVADATRDGGYPPLMLEPIDFGALFIAQREANAAGGEQNVFEGPAEGNA